MDKPELKKHATRHDLEEAKSTYLHPLHYERMLIVDLQVILSNTVECVVGSCWIIRMK